MESWSFVSPCPHERVGCAAALVKKGRVSIGIVVAGGRNQKDTFGDAALYEEKFDTWWPIPSLNTKRHSCFAASIKSTVYVLGGYDSKQLNTAESWSVGSESWLSLEPMKSCRSFGAAVGLAHCGLVIACGGKDEEWKELKSVEIYDINRQQWKFVAPMKHARYGCALIEVGPSTVMAVGGHDGERFLKSAEMYSVQEDNWSDLPDMPVPMCFHSGGCVVHQRRYVVLAGGRNESGMLKQAHCFDLKSGKWAPLPSLPVPREKAALASLGDQAFLVGGSRATRGGSGAAASNSVERWQWTTAVASEFGFEEDRTVSTKEDSSRFRRADDEGAPPPSPGSRNRRGEHLPMAVIASAVLVTDETSVLTSQVEDVRVATREERSGETRLLEQVTDMLMADSSGGDAYYTGSILSAERIPHGRGRMTYEFLGAQYYGDFRNGKREGHGVYDLANGDSYEGSYWGDKQNGQGTFQWKDGRQYEGFFKDDKMHGKGTMTWPNGTVYVGDFRRNKQEGRGETTFPDGSSYDGSLVASKFHGPGTFKFADGRTYCGEWHMGKAHGRGTETDADGTVLHSGRWENDEPVNGSVSDALR